MSSERIRERDQRPLRTQLSPLWAFCKKNWVVLAELLLALALCYFAALQSAHSVDFSPINGTFQNYNPIRRLLAGQLPYRDFQDYLGLGHLYLGSLFTWLFGGSYQSSLAAFTFLSCLFLVLVSASLGRAVLGRWDIPLCVTNLLLVLFFSGSELLNSFQLTKAVQQTLRVGNSARGVRGLILPAVCLLFFAAVFFWPRCKPRLGRWAPLAAYGGVGMLSGLSFLWSNDHGISCWLCLLIMVFVVAFCRTKRLGHALSRLAMALLGSAAAILLLALLATGGHPGRWFEATFGVGGYQSWYYNSTKHFFVYEIDLSFLSLLQALLCLYELYRLYRADAARAAILRFGVPAFANMASFCAVNEYRLLSGGDSREVAYSVLLLTMLYELLGLAARFWETPRPRFALRTASLLLGAAMAGSLFSDELIFWQFTEKPGTYFEELGGFMSELDTDLSHASEFLAGDRFFATYASAQEVVEGTFQPSGVDYIIHVLGDEQREAYLNAFCTADFQYAATIREEYSDWETWIRRANWFFYRELYRDWHPVFGNRYELYWERNAGSEAAALTGEFPVTVVPLDDGRCRLVLDLDPSVNGIADVLLDHTVSRKGGLRAKLAYQSMVQVTDLVSFAEDDVSYDSNYLRSSSVEYIPVTVRNGHGEVELSALPDGRFSLQVNAASCSTIYTVPFRYVEVYEVLEEPDGRTALWIGSSPYSEAAASGVSSVWAGGKTWAVEETRMDDNGRLLLVLSSETLPGTFTFETIGGSCRNIVQLVGQDP